jgi:hypothetical protein
LFRFLPVAAVRLVVASVTCCRCCTVGCCFGFLCTVGCYFVPYGWLLLPSVAAFRYGWLLLRLLPVAAVRLVVASVICCRCCTVGCCFLRLLLLRLVVDTRLVSWFFVPFSGFSLIFLVGCSFTGTYGSVWLIVLIYSNVL